MYNLVKGATCIVNNILDGDVIIGGDGFDECDAVTLSCELIV